MSLSLQRRLGWIACIVLAIVLAVQIWPIRPLYLDRAVRDQVRTSLEHFSQSNGWLLSDLSLEALVSDEARLTYRAHLRGVDLQSCYILALTSFELKKCSAAR